MASSVAGLSDTSTVINLPHLVDAMIAAVALARGLPVHSRPR
jgi:predicted nucleic acid-binding protein